MQRTILVWVFIVTLLITIYARISYAQGAAEAVTIEILGYSNKSYPDYTIDFRVKDKQGRDILNLLQRDIRLVEDSTNLIANFELIPSEQANENQTEVKVTRPSDNQEQILYAKGAAIGIVFDATFLLNNGAPPGTSYLDMGKQAIFDFLDQEKAPVLNPEVFSLFVPMDNPTSQQIQPPEFATYTYDRGMMRNYLQSMTYRNGKTQLYAAIQKAVSDTAAAAQKDGRMGVVLVVSDGGDVISPDAFNETIRIAQENNIPLITFGFGSDRALERNRFNLSRLAEISGGVYKEKPSQSAVAEAFNQIVRVTPAGFYTLKYTTNLLEENNSHQVSLEIGMAKSQALTFVPRPNDNNRAGDLKPLGNVLLWKYFIFAIPFTLIILLIIAFVMSGIHFAKSQSLKNERTVKR